MLNHRARAMWAAALVVAGCASRSTAVRPPMLAQQARALVIDGKAQVSSDDGAPVEIEAETLVDVRIYDGALSRPVRMSIRELVSGCVDDPSSPLCVAGKVGAEPVVVRNDLVYRGPGLVSAAILVGVGGALGACIAVCDVGEELGKGALYAGLGATGVAAGMFLLLSVFGAR